VRDLSIGAYGCDVQKYSLTRCINPQENARWFAVIGNNGKRMPPTRGTSKGGPSFVYAG
jgi:hypothetical protein